MKVYIRNLSQKALKEMGEELGDSKFWLKEVSQSIEFKKCFNITLSDGVMIKTHFDSITIDCGHKLYFLEENEYEKIVIV